MLGQALLSPSDSLVLLPRCCVSDEFQLKCEDGESLEERRQQGSVVTALADMLGSWSAEETWQMMSSIGDADEREL